MEIPFAECLQQIDKVTRNKNIMPHSICYKPAHCTGHLGTRFSMKANNINLLAGRPGSAQPGKPEALIKISMRPNSWGCPPS